MIRWLLALFLLLAPGILHAQTGGIIGGGVIAGAASSGLGCTGTYAGIGNTQAMTNYYGVWAYTKASCGAKLLNVCNSTGGVDVACADMVSDTTTGALVSKTIGGITCPGANCTVKTAYDLTGNGNDATQATVASRPTLVASCYSTSFPCLNFNGSQKLISVSSGTIAQPNNGTVVMALNSTTGTQAAFSNYNVGGSQYLALNGSNYTYAGAVLGVGVGSTSLHYFESVINGASSVMREDSTEVSGNAGSNTANVKIALGSDVDGGNPYNGKIGEAGVFNDGATVWSGTTRTAIYNNETCRWQAVGC